MRRGYKECPVCGLSISVGMMRSHLGGARCMDRARSVGRPLEGNLVANLLALGTLFDMATDVARTFALRSKSAAEANTGKSAADVLEESLDVVCYRNTVTESHDKMARYRAALAKLLGHRILNRKDEA